MQISCFVRDDTERRIQKAVDEAERNKLSLVSAAKDKFIRRIFHEIRTPLHMMQRSLPFHDNANAPNGGSSIEYFRDQVM